MNRRSTKNVNKVALQFNDEESDEGDKTDRYKMDIDDSFETENEDDDQI